jgi:Holliday junction resolvasome RuvABC ATP-dependent DNA helicase subunit
MTSTTTTSPEIPAPFAKIIGQSEAKKQLNFYLRSHQQTRVMPFLLFQGARGCGKTALARETARNMYDLEGKRIPFVEVNLSTVKSLSAFVEYVYIPKMQNGPITVFLDECHNIPNDLSEAFLTLLNSEEELIREVGEGDNRMVIDFRQVSIFFSTTDANELSKPLLDRLTVVDFHPYGEEEIGDIIERHCREIRLCPQIKPLLARSTRGNARSATLRAKDIIALAKQKSKLSFEHEDWLQLKSELSILPYGLNKDELQILTLLKQHGHCTLKELTGYTGLAANAISKGVELYLTKRGLMGIDGKRYIKPAGLKVLDMVANPS